MPFDNTPIQVLIVGGTSETAPLAQGLVERGYTVLVSTFSDAPLDLGNSPNIQRRWGPLDSVALAELIELHGITIAIDALHPYASAGHATCEDVARKGGCRWLRLARPQTILGSNVRRFNSHEQAAECLANSQQPVLLTLGSRFLAPYVQAARKATLPLLARVLDDRDSLRVCTSLGLAPHEIHAQRGPFTVQQNLEHIDRIQAGVLISKEGGSAGGFPEKVQAATMRSCEVWVVERPLLNFELETYPQIDHLLAVL
jgi:precorrin-6A/cobalt-precorrin-6A reductase